MNWSTTNVVISVTVIIIMVVIILITTFFCAAQRLIVFEGTVLLWESEFCEYFCWYQVHSKTIDTDQVTGRLISHKELIFLCLLPLEKISQVRRVITWWVGGVVEMALRRELLGPAAEQSSREAMGNLQDRARQNRALVSAEWSTWYGSRVKYV